MPSKLNAYLLSAVILAALLQCAPGAPVEDALTDSPAGDPSGEEERPTDRESEVWESVLGATDRHKQEFEAEFQDGVKYIFLDNYKIPSLPARCPSSNFSKEACLHRLAQGLLIYTFLLKYVETEYPSSRILSEVRYYSGHLISQIKEKMRNPERVMTLTSSQEDELLRDLDNPSSFHRKMTAHSILRQLHYFLVDGKRAIDKREQPRGSEANRGMAPVTFYYQKLKR